MDAMHLIGMSRYYFHIFNDYDTEDEEGAELPDLNTAREMAIIEARSLAAESIVEHGHLVLSHRVEISCDNAVVETVRFGDAVRILD